MSHKRHKPPRKKRHRRNRGNRSSSDSNSHSSSSEASKVGKYPRVKPQDLQRWLMPVVKAPEITKKTPHRFQKGNKFGPYKKGDVQQPAGKSAATRAAIGAGTSQGYAISNWIRKLLSEPIPGDPQGRTMAQGVAEAVLNKALLGKDSFIKILLDRAEGRVPVTIDVGNTADPLMDLLTEMRKKHQELGPPERSESEEVGAKRREKG